MGSSSARFSGTDCIGSGAFRASDARLCGLLHWRNAVARFGLDHILGLAKVEERKVSKDELMKPLDDELPAPPAKEIEAAAPEASETGQPAG